MNHTIHVTADVTTKEEFEFAVYHTYTSFAGYTGVLISICAIVAFFRTLGKVDSFTSLVLLFCAFLFILVKPVTLYFHSKKKVKEEKNLGAIQYEFGDYVFSARQGERSMTVTYESLYKVRESFSSILIYTEKHHALILPKPALGANYESLKKILRNKAKNASVRLRK